MSENPESTDFTPPAPEPLTFEVPQFDIVEKGADVTGIQTRGESAES